MHRYQIQFRDGSTKIIEADAWVHGKEWSVAYEVVGVANMFVQASRADTYRVRVSDYESIERLAPEPPRPDYGPHVHSEDDCRFIRGQAFLHAVDVICAALREHLSDGRALVINGPGHLSTLIDTPRFHDALEAVMESTGWVREQEKRKLLAMVKNAAGRELVAEEEENRGNSFGSRALEDLAIQLENELSGAGE